MNYDGKASGSWVRLPLHILSIETMSLRAKITLALMIDRQRADGTVHVTADQLANIMGVTTRTIRSSIKELKEGGFITESHVESGTKPVYKLIQVIEPKRRSNV